MSDPSALKSTLARAIRLLTAEGLIDMNGHMSARPPGSDHVLINARQVGRSALRPQDIVTVDLRGRPLPGEGDPPAELPIHTRIYAARPDVHCVAYFPHLFANVYITTGRPIAPA